MRTTSSDDTGDISGARFPGGDVTPAHLDLDTLADLDADALEATRTGQVREHLAGCAECSGALAALGGVRAALAAEPDPGPVPADVAQRLDAALAAVAAERGLAGTPAAAVPADELATRRDRRAVLPRLLAAAAVVGVVGLGGWAALSSMGNGGEEPATTAGGATDTAARELSTPDTADSQALSLAPSPVPEATTAAPPATTAAPPAEEDAPAEDDAEAAAPVPVPVDPEAERARLTDQTQAIVEDTAPAESSPPGCGEAFAETEGVSLLRAVPTTYEGRPAVLLVIVGPGFGTYTGYVVPDCDALPADALTSVEFAT